MNVTPSFSLESTCSKTGARAGTLHTAHGAVQTPVFLPVGTQGTIKALTSDDVKNIGFEMILSNTYHLYLRPGMDIISQAGGLHRFMGWNGGILTDSGGYQIFSLARLRRLNDEGALFRSHIDGSEHMITPEAAVKYQEIIGSDVAMVLDECPPHGGIEEIRTAVERTSRWAERCLKAHKKADQLLFGIVQGGIFPELRRLSAEQLVSLDFPGYAIGGLSIGEAKLATYETVAATTQWLPADKPRYLMGVGSPEDIVEGVASGVDIFDSVLPTRIARNGSLLTRAGRANIRNAVFAGMDKPVDANCSCYTCRTFSAAYLHHLFNAKELLAYRLATIHNLTFMRNLITDIRKAIVADSFGSFKEEFLSAYKPTDEQVRLRQKQKWMQTHSAAE